MTILLSNKAKATSWAAFNREMARQRLSLFSMDQYLRFMQGEYIPLNANSPFTYAAGVQASLNAFGALLNSGTIKIYSGTQPGVDVAVTGTLLVTMTFGATAFASATSNSTQGSMNANSITSGTAGNTNTAGYFALVETGGTVVGTGSVGTSAADLNLSTLSIVSGANVACSAFTVTQPQF